MQLKLNPVLILFLFLRYQKLKCPWYKPVHFAYRSNYSKRRNSIQVIILKYY